MILAGRGPLAIYGHCCKSSYPGRGLNHRAGVFRFVSCFWLDCRETFEVATQIIRKDDGAASTFHGTQRAGTNRLIKRRPTGTRD
jgi:hypothetical protein